MLPGQIGLWIIGVVSALLLCIMGVFSYISHQKYKVEMRAKKRAAKRAAAAGQAPVAESAEETPPPSPAPRNHNDFGFKF